MYLHYYHNKQHCGQVDSELVFNYPKGRHFIVIAHNQEQQDALEAFKLIYGKHIQVVSLTEAKRLDKSYPLTTEIFITKKAGATLDLELLV